MRNFKTVPAAESAAVCVTCHNKGGQKHWASSVHDSRNVACTTCHNPHEPSTLGRLGGFKQEACLKCHTDKSGPFLYEHSSSRVEGCTSCHDVHGSPNRHMLTMPSIADLCFSCHAEAPAWHANFTSAGTNCVTCHSAIHGSNLSPRFLK